MQNIEGRADLGLGNQESHVNFYKSLDACVENTSLLFCRVRDGEGGFGAIV